MKKCSLCKKSLGLDKFYLSHNGSYNFCCKPCDKKRKAVYRAENKDKIALQENKYMNTERGYVMEVINGIFYRHKLMLYIQDHGSACEYCKDTWTYKRVLGTRQQGYNGRGPRIDTNFSIDRLDATKTYILDNLVFCCVGCNLRKNQVRLSDIFNIIRVYIKRKVNNERKV